MKLLELLWVKILKKNDFEKVIVVFVESSIDI